MITQHQLLDLATETVAVCSVLHTLLPPWDFLNEFPRVQKYYKLVIYVIGYLALNGRSTAYQSISMKNQIKNGNGGQHDVSQEAGNHPS